MGAGAAVQGPWMSMYGPWISETCHSPLFWKVQASPELLHWPPIGTPPCQEVPFPLHYVGKFLEASL